ncbi:dihydrouridine synthase (Dus) domain-containing protein [Ditylenchus destructor]|uniref:tRNA-dihydrouridine(16/17) synthase [NAD(P)(+)] n=1 Tax=Ditylenchus destructor TaxID=166010 RepID=A0AAD4R3L0_9BILA|nr:dihydrouridine synthase (Dus) domain-containing protein [Ditylenchus destructor]
MTQEQEPSAASTSESLPINEETREGTDESIKFVGKHVHLSPELPEFEPEFYEWKRNFWKERMKNIKHVVAPMVDQSELAFRMLLRKYDAHLCYTPMIHAHLFVNDCTYRKTSFTTISSDRPLIVQFCANDPKVFLDACRLVEGYCDGVDLNLGCPQMIAKRGHYGAFLQESHELISKMVSMVYKHCRLPLSVKIRVLEDIPATIKYAKMIQDSGASMLAVHGRKRDQKGQATGLADWSYIREIKNALHIPVIANGNIQMKDDVTKCLLETGVDAVMSAEGILSNPSLFSGMHMKFNCSIAQEYLDLAEKYKPCTSAIRAHMFRICHYSLLQHPDLRASTSCVFPISEFREIINELERRTKEEAHNTEWVNEAWNDIIGTLPEYSSLVELIEKTPHWICKPYVRPATREELDNQSVNYKNFRDNKRAELEKLCNETGLSKRQIRKREKRQIQQKRYLNKRQHYPSCENCQLPAGLNCHNGLCKRCCKWECLHKGLNCKGHNFNQQVMLAKRAAFAEQHGTTVGELLSNEQAKDTYMKLLKNHKKENNPSISEPSNLASNEHNNGASQIVNKEKNEM